MPEWFTRFLSRFLSLGVVVVLVGLMPDIAGIDPSQSILRARAGAQQLLTAEGNANRQTPRFTTTGVGHAGSGTA